MTCLGGEPPKTLAELEVEAGGLPSMEDTGRNNSHVLTSVLQIANEAAVKAKRKITAAVGVLYSPKKRKTNDPPLLESKEERPLAVLPSRCPQPAADEGEASRQKGKKAKATNILAIARRAYTSKQISEDLEKGFASVTSVKSKKAIRNTVKSVFREAKGTFPFPPSPDKVKLLGGVLKAAGYKAAGNYLGEYKLMAVECGYQWTDQLERTLKLCKRSTARAMGPKTKAAEVPTSEIGEHFDQSITMDEPIKSCQRELKSFKKMLNINYMHYCNYIQLNLKNMEIYGEGFFQESKESPSRS